ncbi:hypothetical protein K5H97_26015 [Pseudomonas mosselii]|uniref:SMODS and SLOG-associating 2TM effector domain-containing protein n=2 Tax=Pseudomonas mosselii TaxID=78327 RepID=A0ABX9B989_9PSED|nr:hypothetical protein K5H97_26015 [Pseudomonas mosselii]
MEMEMGDVAELAEKWDDMLFGVRRSIRYHQRRRAFFDRLDQSSNMLSVFFGSTAIYGILKDDYQALALGASALVTALASINLVVGSALRARAHSDFVRQYIDLEKRMLGQPDEQTLKQVTEGRLSIEAQEPPVLHVLNAICHNEMMRAMGHDKKDFAKIGPLQRLFAQLFDFREHTIH